MTTAEVVAVAREAARRCTGKAQTPVKGWQWVCGYLAPAGEGYALSAERHLDHHVALAIEADRAAVAREAYLWRQSVVGFEEDVRMEAVIARLMKAGGAS